MTRAAAPRDWDASTYDRVSDPMVALGLEVLGRLELAGDETVLDAGCGSGKLTLALAERLPRGDVIAVDGSPSMVELARAELGERARVEVMDLQDLRLDEPVDAVFSNAVFHWVPDHDRLFERLAGVLRPGGALVAQCGGEGNIDALHAVVASVAAQPPYAAALDGWRGPWRFAGAEETAARLDRTGFADVQCWLERKLVAPEDPVAYLRAVCLGAHLDRLPEDLRDRFIADVADAAGDRAGRLQYVRLNISARRAA